MAVFYGAIHTPIFSKHSSPPSAPPIPLLFHPISLQANASHRPMYQTARPLPLPRVPLPAPGPLSLCPHPSNFRPSLRHPATRLPRAKCRSNLATPTSWLEHFGSSAPCRTVRRAPRSATVGWVSSSSGCGFAPALRGVLALKGGRRACIRGAYVGDSYSYSYVLYV